MRIDVPPGENWIQVSEAYRAGLPFQDPAVIVQAYMGYQHALYESTQGLARLFSHKKTIALVTPAEPAVEAIAVAFSAEGYNVKRLGPAEIADPITAFGAEINDVLFVLLSDDDPVTGRLHDNARLHEALKDKRVFRVRVSHSSFKSEAVARPGVFEVRILSASVDRAIVVAGERFRIQPSLAPRLPWFPTETAGDRLLPLGADEMERRKQAVLAFENQLPPGFKPYFAPNAARTFDRAVIYHSELDGSAIIDELVKDAGDSTAPAGTETAFETTSPCRWNAPRFTEWLLSRGDSEEVVRGLVTIDPARLGGTLATRLAVIADRLSKLQSGS